MFGLAEYHGSTQPEGHIRHKNAPLGGLSVGNRRGHDL